MFQIILYFYKCTNVCFFINISVTTTVQCESYNKVSIDSYRGYINVVGIADPQSCVYKKATNDSRIIISVASNVTKENIVDLDIQYSENSLYLPINVGTEFPNLNQYKAQSRGVIEISKENFAGMMKIRFIDLDYNKITTLTQDMFASLKTLERIDLGKFIKKLG